MPGRSESTAGGILWLTAAKLYFMLTGVALLLALPAFFKRFYPDTHVALYGDYRTVIGLVNWCNMVLIGGTLQAVAKFVSEAPGRTDSVKWTTLRIQGILAGGLTLALLLGAGALARGAYGDPALAGPLRLAAPVVLLYGCYAVVIGCLNGLGRFRHQALMDILFATLKVGLTIGLVAAGLAMEGALGAFVVTAAVMLAISWAVLGREGGSEGVSWRAILAFEGKTLLYAALLNGVLQLDVQLLKVLAPDALGDSSLQTGIYAAALQIGQLPYVATLSVTFVVFPLVSRSTFNEDVERTRAYVRTTNRYSLLMLAGLAAALACNARGVLALVYPDEYLVAAPELAMLTAGYALLAMAVITAGILTASGRPWWSAGLFALVLLTLAALEVVLIPRLGGPGAARGALGAMALAFLAAAVLSWRRFRVFVPPLTLARAALAVGATWALGEVLPPAGGAVVTVGRGVIQFVAFWLVLVLTRELTAADLRGLRRRS
ncbi:MAG: oligosaccharide flippase family protein [Deltaproteobacteria bacterium]|nr:oligosaccharide flippase family protein [Deltaproteobacteria bacterium]